MINCYLPPGASGTERIRRPKQTQAQKAAAKASTPQTIRAVFGDPDVHELAALIPVRSDEDIQKEGGRRKEYSHWVLVACERLVPHFGSTSATVRELRDPDFWRIACDAARDFGNGHLKGKTRDAFLAEVDRMRRLQRGPSRAQLMYFMNSLPAEIEDALGALQDEQADRTRGEQGIAPSGHRGYRHFAKERCLILDGKVTSSPVRTLSKTRIDAHGNEVAIRKDDARAEYGEAGDETVVVYGAKWAVAEIATGMSKLRYLVGIEPVPPGKGFGGEAGVLTDLAIQVLSRDQGNTIDAVIIDRAMRGAHIRRIQTETGRAAITGHHIVESKEGSIETENGRFTEQKLPLGKNHPVHNWPCVRKDDPRTTPDLRACGGTLYLAVLGDGEVVHSELRRLRTQRQKHTTKAGTRFQFHAEYAYDCHRCNDTHTWWESLTQTNHDREVGFNREEYLRVLPTSDDEYAETYGFRNDIESVNALIERSAYGWRMPFYGRRRQLRYMRAAQGLLNSLGKRAYAHYLESGQLDPPQAA